MNKNITIAILSLLILVGISSATLTIGTNPIAIGSTQTLTASATGSSPFSFNFLVYNPTNTLSYNEVLSPLQLVNVISGFTGEGAQPVGIAFSPNGINAYVAEYDPDSGGFGHIKIVNTVSNSIIGEIILPNARCCDSEPTGLAVASNGTLYATDEGLSLLYTINALTQTIIQNVTIPGYPNMVALSPNNKMAYITLNDGDNQPYGNVIIYNPQTNTISPNEINITDSWGVAFSPTKGYAYVTESTDPTSNIVIINTTYNSIVGQITGMPGQIYGVSFSLNGAYAYLAEAGQNKIAVMNTTTHQVVETIPFMEEDSSPFQIATQPNNGQMWVSDYESSVYRYSAYFPSIFSYVQVGPPGTWTANLIAKDSNGNTILTDPIYLVIPSNYILTIPQGFTAILNSTAASGAGAFTYQWFDECPTCSIFTAESNGPGPSYYSNMTAYWFHTTNQTQLGLWSFLIQATNSTGIAENSIPTGVNVTCRIGLAYNATSNCAKIATLPVFSFDITVALTLCAIAFIILGFVTGRGNNDGQ